MTDRPIALDAMGGDRMPGAAIDGALAAVDAGVSVVLVGNERDLRAELGRRGRDDVPVRHADDVIDMHDHAADVRKRRGSSVMVAARMVADGEASAFVSMGHSGATMAAALLVLGRIKGVERPAIVANIPTRRGFTALLDVGANADCRPRMLAQFAVMGTLYARAAFDIDDPSVGLMSIGEEPGKGNELVRESHGLLTTTPGIRFYGNVEGRDLFAGVTDVVVTDGFTGNVVLKLAEGEAKELFSWIREALSRDVRSKVGALLAKPALKSVAARLDPSTYGAQPLVGVTAPVFIGHGSSDDRAVRNALAFASRIVNDAVTNDIAVALRDLGVSD